MKTNQLMMVSIGNYSQPIEHKTMMGHLNSLWDYGNGLRVSKRLMPLAMKDWLNSHQTLELVYALDKKYNSGNSTIIEASDYIELDERGRTRLTTIPDNPFVKAKRGKGGGTWVHLMLLLDAAAWLDADFKVEMYDCFINNKILQWRDDSGDQFIALNAAIDAYLPDRNGKDNTGIFIQCAKLLKEKIKPDNDNWNSASFTQLERRAKIESDLVKFLSFGMVRDYEHLKELIGKL